LKKGVESSVGTGFIYLLSGSENKTEADETAWFPALITNKHVIFGCDEAKLVFSIAPAKSGYDANGIRNGKRHHNVVITLTTIDPRIPALIPHPNQCIDLCAIPLGPLINDLVGNSLELVHHGLNIGFQLTADERKNIRAIEPIAMVGYPSGLWDSVNNAPIVRRGSTATHALVNYIGKPEFLIDAACFPGSSGSPVFLFEDGMCRSIGNALTPGTRVKLLGVLYAGPQFSAAGEIISKPIPHNFENVALTSIPMNLGLIKQSGEI
jgi:hypothetical protein